MLFEKSSALLGSAAVLISASVASAAITVDLRFAGTGDPKSRVVAANRQYTVNFYAQVRGLDSNGANDGINYVYGAIQSEQVNGGSVVGGSGVGVTSVTFHQAFNDSLNASLRTQSDTSLDSIADWAIADAANTSMKPGASGVTGVFIGSPSNLTTVQGTLLDNGTPGAGSEYLLGSFVFTTGADVSGLGTTLIKWLRPTYTAINPKMHATYLDGALLGNGNLAIDSSAGGNYSGNYIQSAFNNVALTAVPEPASIGLLVGGAAMLLGRRRRQVA